MSYKTSAPAENQLSRCYWNLQRASNMSVTRRQASQSILDTGVPVPLSVGKFCVATLQPDGRVIIPFSCVTLTNSSRRRRFSIVLWYVILLEAIAPGHTADNGLCLFEHVAD